MTTDAPLFEDIAEAPAGGRAFWVSTSDGLRLRAAVWTGGARGTAVVLPGRTEFIEKYGRVVGRLQACGYSVVVLDWRGQGLSQRNAAAPSIGHVEDFRHYQRDIEALLAHAAVRDLPRPRHMIAHSMGACIGLRTLLEGADFDSAVFSAPMWHLQMRAATREFTSKMTLLAKNLGFGQRRMPGSSDRPTPLSVTFETNALTSCPDQFAFAVAQITAHPELSLSGPNVHWTRAALEEMARLFVAPLPSIPILTFLGTAETVVSASMIRMQIAKMKQGTLVMVPGARHEIFMERPEIQAMIWPRIERFLSLGPDLEERIAQVSR